ncbi:hypothetical protein [Halovenus salina]|uniref:Uncharacterized protein n=1 Tax=Halovenus salina TaxID=1510225 RepID=A0ABD5VXR1_9EURY
MGVGAGTTAGGFGPLADAGLDQTVTEGETVYLDAGVRLRQREQSTPTSGR